MTNNIIENNNTSLDNISNVEDAHLELSKKQLNMSEYDGTQSAIHVDIDSVVSQILSPQYPNTELEYNNSATKYFFISINTSPF